MALLTAREASEYLHISLFTLSRIEKEGMLVPFRTPGGHRRYSLEMLNEYLERSRSPSSETKGRILVVDDDDELAQSLSESLPTCRFVSADDELRVGIKLAESNPDLIVINTGMSGMDGADLCRRLKRQVRHIKIITFDVPRQVVSDSATSSIDLSALALLRRRIAAALGPGLTAIRSGA
jgi:excisionase family DNA binding protein